jgi:hypothetical protein
MGLNDSGTALLFDEIHCQIVFVFFPISYLKDYVTLIAGLAHAVWFNNALAGVITIVLDTKIPGRRVNLGASVASCSRSKS